MFSSNKNSVLSSKLGHLVIRSKTVIAAAVAVTTMGMAGTTFGAFTDITSITTQFITGSPTSVSNVKGAGSTYSPFQPSSTYTVKYAGDVQKVLSLVAGGTTYNATGLATSVVQRNAANTSDNDTLWYTGSYSGSTVNLNGPQMSSYNSAFAANNLLVGADNLFSNTGNAVGNNTNVDRLDVLFNKFAAGASSAFSIMDRGPTNDHDAFKIAAITAVDKNGNPSAYGSLFSVSDGNWGKTNLLASQQEIILRKNDSVSSNPMQPSDSTGQPIGGILIPSNGLVATGTPVYGYSLFSNAVSSSSTSAQLVNYATLPTADSTSTGGGLDAVATAGVLFTTSVPEPTTIALAAVGTLGLLGRRPKKNLKA